LSADNNYPLLNMISMFDRAKHCFGTKVTWMTTASIVTFSVMLHCKKLPFFFVQRNQIS
jgi:hypothetical protein